MDADNKSYKLYSEVKGAPVEWLFYPYIPFGKITIIQGDSGDGKSSMMMNIIASVTKGKKLPNGSSISPIRVIYQCSEDGVIDTIQPRLMLAGADCRKVAFIDEEFSALTLDDEVIRKAILDFKARLLVIDPFQAYLGDADIFNASSVRRIMKRLSIWANASGCAIVLIGHLNKNQASKDLYRGLGSIDVAAAARSIIQIERSIENDELRIMKHIKSNLAPKGPVRSFTLDNNKGVIWNRVEGDDDITISVNGESLFDSKNKQEKAAVLIKCMLQKGPVKSMVILEKAKALDICKRTLEIAKREMDVKSIRKDGQWYWMMEQIFEEE